MRGRLLSFFPSSRIPSNHRKSHRITLLYWTTTDDVIRNPCRAIQKEIQEINSGLHDESLISALPLQIRETLLDHPSTNSANEITKKPFVTSSVLPLLVPSLPSLPALPSLSLPADDEQVEADHTPDLVKEFTTTSLSPIPQPSTSSRRAKAQPALINSPPKPRASGRKVRKTIEATEAEEGEGAIADEEEEFEFELEDRKGKGRHVDIDPEPEPELEPEGEMEVEVDIEEEEEEGEGEGTGGEGEEGEEEEVEEGVVEVVKKRGRGKGRKGIVAPSKSESFLPLFLPFLSARTTYSTRCRP